MKELTFDQMKRIQAQWGECSLGWCTALSGGVALVLIWNPIASFAGGVMMSAACEAICASR